MKVLLFGATGMVGSGVLRQCLLDSNVRSVVTLGRSATGIQSPKLREIVHPDLFDLSGIEGQLTGFDACFFCLGVSSRGINEQEYARLTYALTLSCAQVLSRLNSHMAFLYISGAGTDSSEQGRIMWARVKGRTENALLQLPFKTAYMLRPGIIQPVEGARSKTPLYQFFYSALKPVIPLLRKALPNYVVTTDELGAAMLRVAKNGFPKRVLATKDIRAVLS